MKLSNKSISVVAIVPTYNSWGTLEPCLKSLQRQTFKLKDVVVVDNGSTDGTSQKVRKQFPGVTLVTLRENTGVTGGRNKGIEIARKLKPDFFLVFDHDMVAASQMTSELLIPFFDKGEVGITTPKIYYWDNKNIIWAAGTDVNLWTGQTIFRGGKDNGQFEIAQEVAVAPAVLLVKGEVLEKVSGFDEKYFATYEDTDFCFRTKKAGFLTFYTPKAIAYHKIPYDSQVAMRRLLERTYYIGRNRVLFMKKFAKSYPFFLLFIPIYLLYYLCISLKYSRPKAIPALIRGTFSGLIET